jgi:hypothetical protein
MMIQNVNYPNKGAEGAILDILQIVEQEKVAQDTLLAIGSNPANFSNYDQTRKILAHCCREQRLGTQGINSFRNCFKTSC